MGGNMGAFVYYDDITKRERCAICHEVYMPVRVDWTDVDEIEHTDVECFRCKLKNEREKVS